MMAVKELKKCFVETTLREMDTVSGMATLSKLFFLPSVKRK